MELWDGYLSDGTLANIDLVRGQAIPDGIYHLVCDVLVKHISGEYLLMQRDYAKSNYGGYYEATAGGAALKGEDNITCAKRELYEETGIHADTLHLLGRYIMQNTIYYSYECLTDCDKSSIRLQKGETISYKWLNEKEFNKFLKSDKMIDTQRDRYNSYFNIQ